MLETYAYAPILRTRNAELKALLYLGNEAKKQIFPVISISPLPNAKHLSNTFIKMNEAFTGYRFALDLDSAARGVSNIRPAQLEFENLFCVDNGFEAYYNLVESIPMAVPVLRLEGGVQSLEKQFHHIDRINRSFFVRIEFTGNSIQTVTLKAILAQNRPFVPVVDMGWAPDVILRQVWAEGILSIIRSLTTEIPFEVVLAASSFPESFAKMGGQKTVRIDERAMFKEIQSKFNTLELTYGDWASTRARQAPVPMTTVPRIDFPLSTEWILFRSEEEDYKEIAKRVIASSKWDSRLKIWGTNVIEWTASSDPTSDPAKIRGPAAATAARINIHLHRQALFGLDTIVSDAPEPFTDDF
jgi:hypothetical protein